MGDTGTFGRNIISVRESLGWPRAELQRRLGEAGHQMHATTLRRIESEEQEPKLSEAISIAEVLGVQVELLNADHTEYPAIMELSARSARFNSAVADVALALNNWEETGIQFANALEAAEEQGVPEKLLIEDKTLLGRNNTIEGVVNSWAIAYDVDLASVFIMADRRVVGDENGSG